MTAMDALQAPAVVSELDYAIGDRVNTLMRRRSITRAGLGSALGVGASAASLKLTGKRAWYASDVRSAAVLLGVNVAVLYGDEPMPEPTLPATVTELNGRKRKTPRPVNGLKQLHPGLITDMFTRAAISDEAAS